MRTSAFGSVVGLCVMLVSWDAERVLGQNAVTLHYPRSPKQTPGVELTLEEAEREPGRRGTRIGYRIVSKGFPSGKAYRLQTSSLKSPKPTTSMTAIEISGTGSLTTGRIGNQAIDLSQFTLAIEDYNKGEFLMIEVLSEDGAVYASDRVHPFPIESRNGDCRLWAELLNKDRKMFGIAGAGFGPNADVRISSSEEKETDTKKGVQRVGPDGMFMVAVSHRAGGGFGTFAAAADTCEVTLRYAFGNQAKGPQ